MCDSAAAVSPQTTEAEEVEKDVTINITNEFDGTLTRMTITAADQTMFAMSTRPACLSLR